METTKELLKIKRIKCLRKHKNNYMLIDIATRNLIKKLKKWSV